MLPRIQNLYIYIHSEAAHLHNYLHILSLLPRSISKRTTEVLVEGEQTQREYQLFSVSSKLISPDGT